VQLSRFVDAQGAKQFALGLLLHGAAARVRRATRVGEHSQTGAAIVRIRRAADEPVALQTIDQLRDVRLDAREAFRELSERQRITCQAQLVERRELRQGQADLRQPHLHPALEHARGVEHGEQSCSVGIGHVVQTCIL